MAHLLARLGEAALKPHKLATGVWHKAVLSAKNAARLRKDTLLEGRCVWEGRGERADGEGSGPMAPKGDGGLHHITPSLLNRTWVAAPPQRVAV